jgi:hypothetical protein
MIIGALVHRGYSFAKGRSLRRLLMAALELRSSPHREGGHDHKEINYYVHGRNGSGDKEGLAIVDLDLSLVAAVREKLPLLKNRSANIRADNGVAANLR